MDAIVSETAIRDLSDVRAEVHRIQAINDDRERFEQTELLHDWALGKNIARPPPHYSLLHHSLLESINTSAEELLNPNTIGLRHPESETAMVEYAASVAELIAEDVKRRINDSEPFEASEKNTLFGMAGRAYALLALPPVPHFNSEGSDSRTPRLQMPLLTAWVIQSVITHMRILKPALHEVSLDLAHWHTGSDVCAK